MENLSNLSAQPPQRSLLAQGNLGVLMEAALIDSARQSSWKSCCRSSHVSSLILCLQKHLLCVQRTSDNPSNELKEERSPQLPLQRVAPSCSRDCSQFLSSYFRKRLQRASSFSQFAALCSNSHRRWNQTQYALGLLRRHFSSRFNSASQSLSASSGGLKGKRRALTIICLLYR